LSKNVMIPLALLEQIIELLGHWNVAACDYSVRCRYRHVLEELKSKQQKLELRDAYAKIIRAGNQDDRDDARIEYLRKKRFLEDNIPF